MGIPSPSPAPQVLNREFFEMRCKILELAAALDRLDRGSGSVHDDPRLEKLLEAIDVLRDGRGDRAEQVQLVFSRPFDDDWQRALGLGRPN